MTSRKQNNQSIVTGLPVFLSCFSWNQNAKTLRIFGKHTPVVIAVEEPWNKLPPPVLMQLRFGLEDPHECPWQRATNAADFNQPLYGPVLPKDVSMSNSVLSSFQECRQKAAQLQCLTIVMSPSLRFKLIHSQSLSCQSRHWCVPGPHRILYELWIG